MKFVIWISLTLFGNAVLASDCNTCACPAKDPQQDLARACESKLSDVSARVECLASARLVATVEFCSRQYASSSDRVTCIKKVDYVTASMLTK